MAINRNLTNMEKILGKTWLKFVKFTSNNVCFNPSMKFLYRLALDL